MDYLTLILALFVSFLLCVLLMPLVIFLSKKLKLRQTILHYVDNHISKSGTPTMGGAAFILACSITAFIFCSKQNSLMLMSIAVFAAYGIIGFLDDFIKIFFKRNKGLSVYQKIVAQVLVAGAVTYFAYNNGIVGTTLFTPLLKSVVDLKMWIIPFNMFIFLAMTNAVNLTDGLDGLAGGVTAVYTIIFALILIIALYLSPTTVFLSEYANLLILCAALIGALFGFLLFNAHPARIFMGDTGALALGGVLSALAIFSRLSFIVPFLGIIYVLTCISVIIQVGYFKLTKKRVFLMAPLHHHFERMGMHENRIVAMYCALTLAVGLIFLSLILM